MDARQSAVNAADIEPYEALDMPAGPGGSHSRRPVRQLAPQHVSLLARAEPRPVPSAFSDPAVQGQVIFGQFLETPRPFLMRPTTTNTASTDLAQYSCC